MHGGTVTVWNFCSTMRELYIAIRYKTFSYIVRVKLHCATLIFIKIYALCSGLSVTFIACSGTEFNYFGGIIFVATLLVHT